MPSASERRQRAAELGLLVDPEDVWLIEAYMWHEDERGYAKAKCFGQVCRIHNLIVGYPIWAGDVVDHINQNKMDNRRANLRIVTNSDNQLNTYKTKTMTHIYNYPGHGYRVAIRRDGVLHDATYETLERAIAERDKLLCLLSPERNSV